MPINTSMAEAMLILIQHNKGLLRNVLDFQDMLEAVIIDWQDGQIPRVELENRLNSLIQEIQKSRDALYALLEAFNTQFI